MQRITVDHAGKKHPLLTFGGMVPIRHTNRGIQLERARIASTVWLTWKDAVEQAESILRLPRNCKDMYLKRAQAGLRSDVTLWLKSTSSSDRNDRHAEESRENNKRSRYVQRMWMCGKDILSRGFSGYCPNLPRPK
jgi:hypothetical protein